MPPSLGCDRPCGKRLNVGLEERDSTPRIKLAGQHHRRPRRIVEAGDHSTARRPRPWSWVKIRLAALAAAAIAYILYVVFERQ